MVTFAELRDFAPGGKAAVLKGIAESWQYAEDVGITTPLRTCHFLAQIALESAGFARLEESLSYTAKRMAQVWPNRFPTVTSAKPFERNPRLLANRVYGGRMGNRDPDDGWNYRGRGLKQLTGRDNYREFTRWARARFEDAPDFERDPDQVAEFPWAFLSGVWFWDRGDLNVPADRNDIRAVTRAINGGYNGLADRRAWFRRAVTVWGEGDVRKEGSTFAGTRAVRAATVGIGGAGLLGTVAEQAASVSAVAEYGRTISDATGLPLWGLAALAVSVGVIVYLLWDRRFIYQNEGL